MKKIKAFIGVWLACIMLFMTMPVCADVQTDAIGEIRRIQENILNWKLEQSGEDEILSGELLDSAGQSISDWYAFAGSRIGSVDGQAAYLSRLRDYVEDIYSDLDKKTAKMNATEWHRIALTVAACGGDPTSFGKDVNGNSINLVADGTWNCLKGDPGKQGVNGYAWALYLMDSKDYDIPKDAMWTRDKILSAILAEQYEDGGFALGNAENSDADITAIVLTALAPYGDRPEVQKAAEKGFVRLSEIQQTDGTMVTYGERTSESTAWTLIALSSWNRNALTDEMFIKEGNTLYDGLKLFLLEDGSFVHSLDAREETEGNNVSTYQALYAFEAVCRQLEGKNSLFDLTDAKTVSQEEINEAADQLPELEKEENSESDTDNGMSRLTMVALAAGVIVLVAVVLILIFFKENKKIKNEEQFAPDDDEW